MNTLDSFPSQVRVAIIGASGGIGSALVETLARHPRVASVHALSRSPCTFSSPKVAYGQLDLADEDSIRQCAGLASSEGPLDIVIVASGMLWAGESLRPEKSMKELDAEHLGRVFAVNAAGPVLVAKHFLPRLRKDSKTVFAALSARVGSIGDNRLGGWYAYRASKAALNMLLKTLSIEHARLWPQSVVIGLHPGTVKTGLSSPYTKHTPGEKLFTPPIAAGYLLEVVDKVRNSDSGGVFAWDGQRIES
ncbi:MAG: SDR family NAD(P)-dependent oxidoreductase [Gammaproteobacteria bacterium]|nr:SDR family NAD(P)-dependent oxidoreductase [Gammaproteobacteria bacterium]MDH4314339.1 SDR family NAD(P)-dependent oxidoreductase [Gammaproteobacteria bacterium]MDH5214519.1 SDR family NAD(P)-dependent oxidoreductase [Gammaproteobacteria bacterium]MDH5500053.1 SDR family NAD(P)-dependent oxidoreductase [Gammaproteobacteria bacterium]